MTYDHSYFTSVFEFIIVQSIHALHAFWAIAAATNLYLKQ